METYRPLQHSTAIVIQGAVFGKSVTIEPFAFVGRPVESEFAKVRDHGQFVMLDDLYRGLRSSVVVGDSTIVRSGAIVYDNVSLGRHVEIGHNAVVREEVSISDYVRVWPLTSIRKAATIGKGSRVGGVVGDRSKVGEYVTTLGSLVHDYRVGVGGEVEAAPELKDGCVVSRGAVVVGDVTVGEFAFVAAGAIVRRDVGDRLIVAGNPARVVGEREDSDVNRVQQRMMRGDFL